MAEITADTKIVPSACQLCIACCGINLHVREGRVVKVEGRKDHPINRGRLCPKGSAIPEVVHHPDRLQYPMKRQGSSWQRITWDEALDTIAEKLKDTKQTYGAKSVAVCLGMVFLSQARANIELIRRFTDAFGTPNVFSVDSMCFRLRLLSYILTLGRWGVADLENSRCIILWGHNPDASTPPRSWWMIPKAMKNGAKLIVIDPRRTPFAKKANIHACPRPGSDTALALGLMNVIISEGLYDKEFVKRWTVGFDELATLVKDYPPEKVENITWVPAQTVIDMARLFANTKPACIMQGWDTLDQKSSGVNNARAVAILHAITGNFDVAGGMSTPPPFHLRPIRMLDKTDGMPLGTDRFPLHYSVLGRLFGEGQGMVLPEVILKSEPYPVKAMIVAGSNLLMSWPNSKKIEAALKKLDFLVVMDQYMGETAKLANIVLPAATFAERTEPCDIYMSLGIPWVTLRQKAVQIGECWPDIKFWMQLARRMGYVEYFPWKDEIEAYDYLMEPTGLSVKALTENASGMYCGTVTYRNYESRGLRTPSGKVEIYSETLAKMGQDPLPVHREPPESPVSTPELAKKYPLILTTGARVVEYLHSQLRNVHRLHRLRPEPEAEMNPETAAKYGIKDKDKIRVESPRGSIEIKAKLTEDIIPGIVSVTHGWHEANINILTDETPADPVGGNPSLKALLCRVERV